MLIGLVGKPSVGKSTFFKAATLAEVEIASYPFTTIKPNSGIGYIKIDCIDKEFGVQCNPSHGFCLNGKRFVPIELIDVAGLVPGASEGKGLGNQFLDDLRQADIFIHIVDSSGRTDFEGKLTENHNPCDDVKFLEEELNFWYYNIFMKVWKTFARKTEMEKFKFSEAIAKQFSGLKVNEEQVKEVLRKLNFPERASTWTEEQIKIFAKNLRELSKPMIVAANKIDVEKGEENYEKMKKEFPNLIVMPCSADLELALREATRANLIKYIPGDSVFEIIGNVSEKQRLALEKIKESIKDKKEGTGVQAILNKAVLEILKYIPVFPASANKLSDSKGNILPDCFLMPPNSTALDFAYKIHQDIGNKFIRAVDARTKKMLGKSYELKFRDALEIITG
jgi:ribosome-binding ATPase